MPVNKTGPMMKLEGAPLQALYDKVVGLEDQVARLKQMVKDQLHEIMELRSAAGAIERNAPPNVAVDEMNTEMQDNPIGTSAIEMTPPQGVAPPEGDGLPPLADYPPPYDR